MLISICVPCMNRTVDLKKTLPKMIRAAEASPPAEINLLDYSSNDGMLEFVNSVRSDTVFYCRYEGAKYYHLAHGYNLAALSSIGQYLAIMGADAVLSEDYLVEARKLIEAGCLWMRGRHYKGIIVIERHEFHAAGGYDERFELYGGEDKDLENRLLRRGLTPCIMPDGVVKTLRTPDADKIANYRKSLTKREMMQIGSQIRKWNDQAGLLVANEGREWGSWNGPQHLNSST